MTQGAPGGRDISAELIPLLPRLPDSPADGADEATMRAYGQTLRAYLPRLEAHLEKMKSWDFESAWRTAMEARGVGVPASLDLPPETAETVCENLHTILNNIAQLDRDIGLTPDPDRVRRARPRRRDLQSI